MKRFSLIFFPMVVVALCGTGAAQPVQEDFVLTSDTNPPGVYYTTWPSSTLSTLAPGLISSGITMAYENDHVYVIGGKAGNLYRLSSLGVRCTISTMMPSGGNCLALDQDGSYVVGNSVNGLLYRVIGNKVTTFWSMSSSTSRPSAICRDGTTGDWIVGTQPFGILLSVDRVTGSSLQIYQTTGANSCSLNDVAYMPRTDEFAVVQQRLVISTLPPYQWNLYHELLIITRKGSVRVTREIPGGSVVMAVTVNQKTGRIYLATVGGWIWELDSDANIVTSRSYGYTNLSFQGIQIWGDRNVSVTASGEPATKAQVNLCFDRSKNKPCIVALSLGQRPGIVFGSGNVLNLAPDSLFLLTAGGALPWWTEGFAGTLSGDLGTATASFTIPIGLTPGTCFHVGAVAVNPALPDGLDVGNVECIQVR